MLRRWLLRVVFALAVFVALVVVALLIGVRTAPVQEAVRLRVVALLGGLTDADVRIGAIRGSFVHTIVVENVRVAVDGHAVARVPRLEIVYALFPLLRGRLRLERVTLSGARLRLVRTPEGWQLPHARGGEEGGSSSRTILVDR